MIAVHEVRKVLSARASKDNEFVAAAPQLRLIPVDSAVALSAAALSRDHRLPMADNSDLRRGARSQGYAHHF
jgi:hypothetical protein